jgi:hypothetical protein
VAGHQVGPQTSGFQINQELASKAHHNRPVCSQGLQEGLQPVHLLYFQPSHLGQAVSLLPGSLLHQKGHQEGQMRGHDSVHVPLLLCRDF